MADIKKEEVKRILYGMGADLIGVAPVDRFGDAPKGFHPHDVLQQCRSVIVIAKAFPAGTIFCNNNLPYTIAKNTLSDTLDKLSVEFCTHMERYGVTAVPTGTMSYSFDERTDRLRAVISAKHSAVAAGLGRIGKNTLVTTPEYGNMVWFTAVLTDAELEGDDVLTGDPCPDSCSLCKDHCPVGALGRTEMDQMACHSYTFKKGDSESVVFNCHTCRTICPLCLGTRNRTLRIDE